MTGRRDHLQAPFGAIEQREVQRLRELGAPADAIYLLVMLRVRADAEGQVWDTAATLTNWTNRNPTAVKNSLKWLKEHCVVSMGPRAGVGGRRGEWRRVISLRPLADWRTSAGTAPKFLETTAAPAAKFGELEVEQATTSAEAPTNFGRTALIHSSDTPNSHPKVSQQYNTEVEDAAVTEATALVEIVAPRGTDLQRIRRRLYEYRAERPNVDLVEQVRKWTVRAESDPIRDADAALFGWLAIAKDGPTGQREQDCVVAGCTHRGYGDLRRCPGHSRCVAAGCKGFGSVLRGDLVLCVVHDTPMVDGSTTETFEMPMADMSDPRESSLEVREWWAGVVLGLRNASASDATEAAL